MKVGFVSTYVMGNSSRQSILQAQSDLMKASYEATTGRVYDPGMTLGGKTGRFINNESQINYLNGLKDTNNLATQRMAASQTALNSLVLSDKEGSDGVLNAFNKVLMGDPLVSTPKVMQTSAQSALDSFVSALNTNYNGEYVFGGTNTSQAPFEYYKAGSNEGTSETVQDSFRDFFGFSPDDPAVADISEEQMQEYIDGPFSDLFEDPSWGANFSNASDTPKQNRISASGETVNISVSANEDGFRHAMKNLILVAEFGNVGLSDEAQAVVSDRASVSGNGVATGTAITEIITTSSTLGSSEERVKRANERIEAQLSVLNGTRNELIGANQVEASYQVMALQNMLSISYSLTAQISRMSLVNYL